MVRVILAVAAVVGGFLILRKGKRAPAPARRRILIAVSILYGLGFLYFTLLSRDSSHGNRINLVPFYTVWRSLRYPLRPRAIAGKIVSGQWNQIFTTLVPLRTALLNIFLFVPLGYLLPEWRKEKRTGIGTVFLTGLCLSCTIEIIQHVASLGWCDVDDLICNIFGALLGYLVYRLAEKRNRRRERKENE